MSDSLSLQWFSRDLLLDTLRTLWSHKLRTFLTMFGIAWGIISITLMVAAGEGLRVGQKKQQETFAKDLMIFFDGRTSMQAGGLRAGREVNWQDEDAPAVRAGSHCLPLRLAGTRARGSLTVRSLYNNATPEVTGSYPPFAEIRSHQRASRAGSTTGATSKPAAAWPSSAAISRSSSFPAARRVGETIILNDIPYTVIGVMDSQGPELQLRRLGRGQDLRPLQRHAP